MKVNSNEQNQVAAQSKANDTQLTKSKLTKSLSKIKQTVGDHTKVAGQTKINEQELFASLLHLKLKDEQKGVAKKFINSFTEKFKQLTESGSSHVILKAARRAINSLVNKESLLSKEQSKEIRKYAIGLAQLDNNILLQTTEKSGCDSQPVKELDQAFKQIKENNPLTDTELKKFQAATRKELAKADAKETSTKPEESDKVPEKKPEVIDVTFEPPYILNPIETEQAGINQSNPEVTIDFDAPYTLTPADDNSELAPYNLDPLFYSETEPISES